MSAGGRYRFDDFVLSSSRRILLRSGREVALVPRYLDLLLLLVGRRGEAISRREILETVWSDVFVSDGALSQAVRTLRRALDDDPRQSRYIRTVSRHGYQFVHSGVIEESDAAPLTPAAQAPAAQAPVATAAPANDFDSAFAELVSDAPEDARRAAAETLHALGTERAVARLRAQSGGWRARALLRDARWELPGAGAVPVFGEPAALRTVGAIVSLRLRRVLRAAGNRYFTSIFGATLAGMAAGAAGGLALYFGPESKATFLVVMLLPLVGGAIGAAGASGVAAGLCCAEVLIRSYRGLALALFGAAGGGAVGTIAHAVGGIALEGLFGQDLSPVAGGLEGIVLGAATGLGYALATPRAQGLATPRGGARPLTALAAGASCMLAAMILSASGSYLGAMSLDLLARRFPGSQVGLEPLARLLGEGADPGPVTRIAIGGWEGLMFGFGTVLGLTHRPQQRPEAPHH